MSELVDQVRSLAEPVLARHGADVVDIEVKEGKTRLVRVIADQPDGIDLDTCEAISRELSRMLDIEDPFDGRYTLEVTSPGLDRPLRTAADFRRNIGRRVRVVLEGSQVEGDLDTVDDDAVTIEGTRVPLDQIRTGTIVLPW